MLTGTPASDDVIFGKAPARSRRQGGDAPTLPQWPRASQCCPIPSCQAPRAGWALLKGDPAPSSRPSRAALALHGVPEHAGPAGRAWRAGYDVNPGGGGVGSSAPVPSWAHTPVMAKPINTLFPASKSFTKVCRSPQSCSPPATPCRASRLPGQALLRGGTCRAWVNFPALPVAGWSTLARPPQHHQAMHARWQLLHHAAGAWAGHIGGAQWSEPGVIRAQKGLFPLKGVSAIFYFGFPREISPGISDFPSSKAQGSETGDVSQGWAGHEPGITSSLLSEGG